MMGRRIACSFTVLLALFTTVVIYYSYFKRPPTKELLSMNNRRTMTVEKNGGPASNTSRSADSGMTIWEEFVRRNKLVSVGSVWDRGCEDKGRTTIGAVVMVPDEETGGVMTRTFINHTLHADVEEGELFLEVQYNHQPLFDNHWDLCTVEEDLEPELRTVYCPINKGFLSQVKDRKIPSYLPKGQYFTKSWVIDQDGGTLMCGYTDFVL